MENLRPDGNKIKYVFKGIEICFSLIRVGILIFFDETNQGFGIYKTVADFKKDKRAEKN